MLRRGGPRTPWRPDDRVAFGSGARLAGTRTTGPSPDGPVVVLLHGLTESGTSFGAHYDRLPATVVVPDLVGFGRSLHVPTPGYDTADHVRALSDWLDTHLSGRPVMLVGHSMGGRLALHLAATLATRGRAPLGVVAMSTGLYDDRAEGVGRIRTATPVMSRLIEGRLAELVCHQVCERPRLGALVWTVLGHGWPGPVARGGALHTWASFTGTLEDVVLRPGYLEALRTLEDHAVPVSLLNGTQDRMPVPGRAEALSRRFAGLTVTTVEGAGHAPHITDPQACVDHLGRCLTGWSTTGRRLRA